MTGPDRITNRTFDELAAGQSAELVRPIGTQDRELLAALTGSLPTTVAGNGGATAGDSAFVGALVASALDTVLPGPGTRVVSLAVEMAAPLPQDGPVTVRLTVRGKHPGGRVVLDATCHDGNGASLASAEADVVAPAARIEVPRAAVPGVHLHSVGASFKAMTDRAASLAPVRTAVVHPCDSNSLIGALDARDRGLIVPVLVGPRGRIEKAAEEAGLSIAGLDIVDTPHSHAAADAAVALAREAKVEALMKGSLHTDELMGAVVRTATGLRTERHMSHVYALDVPHYPKPLFITDAAISIYPSLADKVDIIQNAIDLCHALGIALPKVAILSAVETVNAQIRSTVEAAALCKMADRGQITGGLLDGPLAFDNAVSHEAAATKHIVSPVAGDADILVAPDLEAGNMAAKQLIYLAGAEAAGIVLGARVPIMLTSRADGPLARMTSCALAQLFVRWRAASPV